MSDNFKLSTDGESCVSANTERVMSGNNGVCIKLVNKYAEHVELVTDNGSHLYKKAFKNGEKLAEPQRDTSTGRKGTEMVSQPCSRCEGALEHEGTYRLLLTRLCDISADLPQGVKLQLHEPEQRH